MSLTSQFLTPFFLLQLSSRILEAIFYFIFSELDCTSQSNMAWVIHCPTPPKFGRQHQYASPTQSYAFISLRQLLIFSQLYYISNNIAVVFESFWQFPTANCFPEQKQRHNTVCLFDSKIGS